MVGNDPACLNRGEGRSCRIDFRAMAAKHGIEFIDADRRAVHDGVIGVAGRGIPGDIGSI